VICKYSNRSRSRFCAVLCTTSMLSISIVSFRIHAIVQLRMAWRMLFKHQHYSACAPWLERTHHTLTDSHTRCVDNLSIKLSISRLEQWISHSGCSQYNLTYCLERAIQVANFLLTASNPSITTAEELSQTYYRLTPHQVRLTPIGHVIDSLTHSLTC
jgi:hypothetical protein